MENPPSAQPPIPEMDLDVPIKHIIKGGGWLPQASVRVALKTESDDVGPGTIFPISMSIRDAVAFFWAWERAVFTLECTWDVWHSPGEATIKFVSDNRRVDFRTTDRTPETNVFFNPATGVWRTGGFVSSVGESFHGIKTQTPVTSKGSAFAIHGSGKMPESPYVNFGDSVAQILGGAQHISQFSGYPGFDRMRLVSIGIRSGYVGSIGNYYYSGSGVQPIVSGNPNGPVTAGNLFVFSPWGIYSLDENFAARHHSGDGGVHPTGQEGDLTGTYSRCGALWDRESGLIWPRIELWIPFAGVDQDESLYEFDNGVDDPYYAQQFYTKNFFNLFVTNLNRANFGAGYQGGAFQIEDFDTLATVPALTIRGLPSGTVYSVPLYMHAEQFSDVNVEPPGGVFVAGDGPAVEKRLLPTFVTLDLDVTHFTHPVT